MAENTKIQWVDHTWNPWRGCEHAKLPDGTKHPGCDHCYAELQAKRNPSVLGIWGADGTRPVGVDKYWDLPRQWQKRAAKTGVRESCFPSFMDPFEDRPELVPLRERMFGVIDECPNVDFILLTKRPQNVPRMWPQYESYRVDSVGRPLPLRQKRPNVWLLASVSDQPSYDAMTNALCMSRDLVPVLGVSYEPAITEVDFRFWNPAAPKGDGEWMAAVEGVGVTGKIRPLDWVIIGGESGSKARPFDLAWARSAIAQCKAANVPCFVKQVGSNARERYPSAWTNGYPHGDQSVRLIGDGCGTFSVTGLRDKKGGDWNEWPADLCVRQRPTVRIAV